MFRYLAIAWPCTSATSATMGLRLSTAWQQKSAWQADLLRPGLHVFSTGTRPGVNEAFPLRAEKASGVVLGQLFRPPDSEGAAAPPADVTDQEAARILNSGGQSVTAEFWGRYIAFMQTETGATLVLRDPSGMLPCFMIQHQGVSIVFSWLEDALQLLTDERPSVNWEVLSRQVLSIPTAGRQTALEQVSRVLPGEVFDLHARHAVQLWDPRSFAGHRTDSDFGEAARRLRSCVRSCTRAWASCYPSLLLRLSGGVDSSILLSCLAPSNTAADVVCLNYHSPGHDGDERHYAMLTAARVGRDLLQRERDRGFRIDRALEAARMPDPVHYIGLMNAGTDARIASSYGACAMFTGAGGDSLFYELPSWWPAADYLQDNGIDAGFPAALLDAARLGRLSIWRTLKLALKERMHPDLALRSPILQSILLSPDFAAERMRQRASPQFTGRLAADMPIGKYMQMLGLTHPIGYYDAFEQATAPELVLPLLSQPLVELCLQMPSYLLTRGGRGRALARQAFSADLPPEITHRHTKGGMSEHVYAVLDGNIDLVKRLLLDGELCRRGILNRAAVESVLAGRPSALTVTPGQLHSLVAIESWLTRWPA